MKSKSIIIPSLLMLLALFAIPAWSQDAAPTPAATPEQQAAKLKAKWTKAFEEARGDFQNSNDRESAEFAGRILASLEQPGGSSPAAFVANIERVKKQVRKLILSGAMDSASKLSNALSSANYEPGPGPDGPVDAKREPGGTGTPGPNGLVLYMSFDAPPTNGVVSDESGMGNHGKVSGAKWVAEGRFGGAYRFSLTNFTDQIVVPNSDSLNPETVTVSAWIKTSDTDGFYNRIVDKSYRRGYSLSLNEDGNGKSSRGKLDFTTAAGGIMSDQRVGDGRWHHVAAAYDGQTLRLYVDGGERTKRFKNYRALPKNNWNLYIGNLLVGDGECEFVAFDGLIDEVRIYNRALSADEIKTLATATQAGVEIAVSKPATSESTAKPAAERLKQIKSLFDQGLISKEDYDKKVKEIMDSL